MFILILISSATYTLFQSASGSFKDSYNKVVSEGRLHDAVVKENFKISQADEVIVKLKDQSGHLIDINQTNIKDLPDAKTIIASPTQGEHVVKFSLQTSKDYPTYNLTGATLQKDDAIKVKIDGSGNIDWATAEKDLKDIVGSFAAEITFMIEQQLSGSFTQALNDIYKDELVANEMKSITVTSGANAYKVVQYNNNTEVNKMIAYDGSNSFTNALTNQQMIDELKLNPATGHKEINTLKGFKIQAVSSSAAVSTFVDTSSYQAIVSPSYAQANGIIPLQKSEFEDMMNSEYSRIKNSWPNPFAPRTAFVEITQAMLDAHPHSFVTVGATPFFVIGVGTTPDMSYPIIDIQHPTVNTKEQAIVYVNNRGYERIVDGFRTNPQENYISLKFDNSVSSNRVSVIKNEIEQIISTGEKTNVSPETKQKFDAYVAAYKIIPTGVIPGLKMVTDYDDKNDQYTLTYERISFLNTLQSSISTISWVTTTMLVVFVSAIVLMVFKVLISTNRKQMATMLALGYSKTRIAFTTSLISFAVGTLPAAIGYVVGHFSQTAFVNQFSDFWTLPTKMESFSWISLLITVGLPTLLLFLLIAVVTIINIRHTIPDMLRDSINDNSHIVAKMVAPFKFIGIKTKYAISLVFRNAGKLILTAIATSISALALLVGASTIGASGKAYNETVAVTNYEYKVDLATPTIEGGEYRAIKFNELVNLPHNETYPTPSSPAPTKPFWHIPSLNDAPLIYNSTYLDNAVQTQVLLENNVFNAWKIATSLMPENQLNIAKQNYQDLFANKTGTAWDKLSSVLSSSNNGGTKPFIISYRNPIIDNDDETYTYIDTNLDTKHGNINYHVTGLTQSAERMYNVNTSDIDKTYDSNHPEIIPVMVNKYMSSHYSWNVGTLINGSVNNSAFRNFVNKSAGHTHATFKVVGIYNGYNDGEIITTQRAANNLLGLSANAFNGVMTSHEGKDAAILNTLPLYAPSGMYFGTDTLRGIWDQKITSLIQNWTFKDLSGQTHNGSELLSSNSLSDYYTQYSHTPYVSQLNKVNWKQADKYTFESVSQLSNVLINTISAVSIALSVIFTGIVTSLIIRTNRKRISTLWTLGYRKREILKIFMSNFILPLAISIAVAVPLSFGLLEAMRVFIMDFGHILIPFELAIWAPFVVIGIISIIFFGSTWFSIASLSSGKALHAFKED